MKFLLALFLILLPVLGRASFVNDGSTGFYVAITDNDVLDLPDGDWTVAGWIKVNNNAGTSAQKPILAFPANINLGGNPAFTIMCSETSSATAPGDLRVGTNDADTDSTVNSTNTICDTTGTWQHVLAQRTGGQTATVTLYVDNVSEGSNVPWTALDGSTFATDSGFAGRGSTTQGAKADVCEWTFWTRALSADERAALSKGYSARFFPNSLTWYIPAVRDYVEWKVPLTLTNNSTTVGNCPPLIYPY